MTHLAISQIIKDAAKEAANNPDEVESGELVRRVTKRIDEAHHSPFSWKITASRIFSRVVGFDSILWAIRATRRVLLWSQAGAVVCIQSVPQAFVSESWVEWADVHQTAAAQAQRLSLTAAWIDALFDVHGHQVFSLGAFNADPHPGNILVIEEEDGKPKVRRPEERGQGMMVRLFLPFWEVGTAYPESSRSHMCHNTHATLWRVQT